MYVCMNCFEECFADELTGECESCGVSNFGSICPVCREARDETMYWPEYEMNCHDCSVYMPKMQELGITGVDDTVIDIIYENVRMRNMEIEEGKPISQISLRKGKLQGWIQDNWHAPVVYEPSYLYWQVID